MAAWSAASSYLTNRMNTRGSVITHAPSHQPQLHASRTIAWELEEILTRYPSHPACSTSLVVWRMRTQHLEDMQALRVWALGSNHTIAKMALRHTPRSMNEFCCSIKLYNFTIRDNHQQQYLQQSYSIYQHFSVLHFPITKKHHHHHIFSTNFTIKPQL